MKLSIIIPIYNVEKYIEKCLLSCITQDIQLGVDYEIICVNDGTQDNSAFLAKTIANQYNGITVLNQENRGLSEARNTGLRNIHGEYVWFVDSDDWIEENCLARIISQLKDDLDILQLQFCNVYEEKGEVAINKKGLFYEIKTGREVFREGKWCTPAQFSVYRTEFLNRKQLTFVPGIYHEDSEFKPRAIYIKKKIAWDSNVSYYYLRRDSGSITSTFKLKNGLDILNTVIRNLLRFIDQEDVPHADRIFFYRLISMNMNTVLLGLLNIKDKNDKEYLIKAIKKDKFLFQYMLKSRKIKYIFEGLLFLSNIKLGLIMYNCFKAKA